MKIKPGLKIRNVVGENIVMVRSNTVGSTSKILSFNQTSVFLWESLEGKEFAVEDVIFLLTGKYDVGEEKAREDAAAWVAKLNDAGVLE